MPQHSMTDVDEATMRRFVPQAEYKDNGNIPAVSIFRQAFNTYRHHNTENASLDIDADPFGSEMSSSDDQGRVMEYTHSLGKKQEWKEDQARGHIIIAIFSLIEFHLDVSSDFQLPEGALMNIREASELSDDDGLVMLFQKTLGLQSKHYMEYSASLPGTGIDDAQILRSYLYNVQISLAVAQHPQAVDAAPLAHCILKKYENMAIKHNDNTEDSNIQ